MKNKIDWSQINSGDSFSCLIGNIPVKGVVYKDINGNWLLLNNDYGWENSVKVDGYDQYKKRYCIFKASKKNLLDWSIYDLKITPQQNNNISEKLVFDY